MKIDKENTSSR